MYWLIRRGKKGVVHRAVREGGENIILMMTSCGLSIRWDLPHKPWERKQGQPTWHDPQVTCQKCKA